MIADPNHTPQSQEFLVSTLGPGRFPSPLRMSTVKGDGVGNFTHDQTRVQYEIVHTPGRVVDPQLCFERAGARQQIFFDPATTRAAVVTCGGLCPGLNNVIRSLYFELRANYGIREVLGIRYGYQGLNSDAAQPPIRLTNDKVEDIHKLGGCVLGTSRGPQDPRATVDYLCEAEIDLLFCVGGDGTQRGAHQIAQEIFRRKLPISVIGIPKTIDNDIKYVWRTFGFLTALEEAQKIISCAHNEATAVRYGVALVKLMGREAGFIAAGATAASGQVNFTLVPEIRWQLEGDDGLFEKLRRRLLARGHAVIVVAEGAGQELLPGYEEAHDASGNRRLGDIGLFLKQQITDDLLRHDLPAKIKYFDPSYHIRSVRANTADSLLCEQLARSSAHAGMAGKTDMLIGLWHNQFVHVPLAASTGILKRLSPESDLWMSVLAMTGQEKW